MKIERHTTERIEIPVYPDDEKGARFRLELDIHDEEIRSVTLQREDCEGMFGQVFDLPLEEFERVADVVRRRRVEAADYRLVCADHGFHPDAKCPVCDPADAVQEVLS